MKNIIKVMVLSLVIINGLWASQVTQGFATSIFWQCPVTQPKGYLMFSEQPISTIKNIYTTIPKGNSAAAKDFNNSDSFAYHFPLGFPFYNQYLLGSYFGLHDTSKFHVTLATKTPVKSTKKTVKSTDDVLTLAQARLSLLRLFQTIVNPQRLWNYNFVTRMTVCVFYLQNGDYIRTLIYPTNEMYKNIATSAESSWVDAVFDASSIVFKTMIDRINPKTATNFTVQSFMPIPGVKMQGNTYFAQDNILFALHLITPGKGTTKLTKNTSIADVMANQNTYPDMYPLEGVSPCGDNFGF